MRFIKFYGNKESYEVLIFIRVLSSSQFIIAISFETCNLLGLHVSILSPRKMANQKNSTLGINLSRDYKFISTTH